MKIVSLRFLPPLPRGCERPRTGSSSSYSPVIPKSQLFTHNGCCLGHASFKQASLRTSYNAPQKMYIDSKRKHAVATWSFRTDETEFGGRHYDIRLHRTNETSKSIIARLDFPGAASTDSAYPKPEITLGSKIRGICFYVVTAVAAIPLFVLMVIGHPFVILFDRYRRKFQHLIAKIWARMTVAPFFKITLEGIENLPPADTPAVYVSNHQSFLDIYALLTLGRSFKFISKTSIFLFPIIGWAMFMMGVIPLKRMDTRSQLDCLKRCTDLVKKGASVFFFPEGTRSKDGTLGPFKKGAFSVATKTGVPVVPITIMGTGDIMPAGKERIVNSGFVKVIVHKSIQGKNAEELCNEARNVIAETLNR